MFERKQQAVLPRSRFYQRLARSAAFGLGIVVFSLVIGITGYHVFEHMPLVDAFANASMILSGMGPMGELKTTSGKIFAGIYALYSGLALVTTVGVVFAPVFHRFLHKFHLEEDEAKTKTSKKK